MTETIDTIGELRAGMEGAVILPGEPDFDGARLIWNGGIDRSPAVVARCVSSADVVAALAYARERGLEVAVRGGGHGYWGAAVPENGMMIDLSALNGVTVDPVERRARVGGGATLADLDAATQEHGLAVTGGTVSHTGVGGLTLGGGFGWLARYLGLSIDNLVSAEVVLVDGRCVRASAESHPDLFWALRGGGGNFGVVTEFEFRIHEVGPIVNLGLIFFTLDRAEEAVRAARDTIAGLPREAGAAIAGINAPPAPFVPEHLHLAPGLAVIIVGLGSVEEHAALLAPLRAAGPAFEHVTPLPYTELQQMLDDGSPWGIHAYTKGLYLHDLTDDAADVFADHVRRRRSPMSQALLFAMGGAFADVADVDTAFGGSRGARWTVVLDAIAPDAGLLAAEREWARSAYDALRPFAENAAGYVNLMAEYDEDRVRATYGTEKYERLARIKAEYDPGNVLHLNANIKPI